MSSVVPLWAHVTVAGVGRTGESLWSGVWELPPKVAVVVALVAAVLVMVRNSGNARTLPFSYATAYKTLGVVPATLFFYALLTGPRGGELGTIIQPVPFLDVERGPLAFTALGLAMAIVAGGFVHERELTRTGA